MNKSINLTFVLLSILVVSTLVLMPMSANAGYGGDNVTWGSFNNSGYNSYGYNNYNYGNSYSYASSYNANPAPAVYSITPNTLPSGIKGNIKVLLTGYNFIPNSLAQFNNSYRPTTFINSQQLEVVLSEYDLNTIGSFVITVFNPMPGGGTSNGVAFNVNSGAVTSQQNTAPLVLPYDIKSAPSTTTKTAKATTTTKTNTVPVAEVSNDTYGSLTANTIFGSNSFAPSGIIQWVVFAILLLLIIILVRRVFGFNEKYQRSPMKHA